MKNPKTIYPVTPKIRRALACLLIFALVVTLAPVQSLAQTVQREKTVAGQLPGTAVYTISDCTVTYDTALHEALSPDITITITNHGQQLIHKWQLRFHYPYIINPSSDIQINSHQNGYYTFTPTQQTMEIPAGQNVQFSFAVSGETLPEPPEQIDLIINDEEFAPLPTPTPAPTVAATATPTVTATVLPTATAVPTVTPTITALPTATAVPTAASTVTALPAATAVPTVTATVIPTTTAVPATTPTATATVMPTPVIPMADQADPSPAQTTPHPTLQPTTAPSLQLADTPLQPTSQPTTQPTQQPTAAPAETTQPAEDLYIYTNTTISEDTICGNLFLMGGSLTISGCTVTIQGDYFQNGGSCQISSAQITVEKNARITTGDLAVSSQGKIRIKQNFTAETATKLQLTDSFLNIDGNLQLNNVASFNVRSGNLNIQGDFTCDTTGGYVHTGGTLTVLGTLTATQGKADLSGAITVDIHGNLSTENTAYLTLSASGADAGFRVRGDLIINSTGRTNLKTGTLTLMGDLIQKESGYTESLCAQDNFQILLCANQRQKIQLAHPEAVNLGTLDLGQAAGVDAPDEIHAKELHGFERLDKKDRLDLYLSGMSLRHDEIIPSRETIWHGRTLTISDYNLTAGGDLEFADMYNLNISGGNLTVPGNLTCAFGYSYSQSGGSLNVGGNLTVTQGSLQLQYGTTADIRGSLTAQQTGSLYLYGRGELPDLTVSGDLIINSTKRTNLQAGNLTLLGNLIQKESGYAESLYAQDDFQILLCADQRQKIQLAHPEAVNLGTLDLRQAARVDTPDEIHAKELHGFDKLDQKDRLDLYLSGMSLTQDETIPSRKTVWHSGTLTISDYSLTAGGDLEFDGMYNLNIIGGSLTVPGNLTCAFRNSYSQSGGSLNVGGNLTITKGSIELQNKATADIHGDLTVRHTGFLCLYGRAYLPDLTVVGDLIIDSTGRTILQAGTLTLLGNLIQKESGYAESLHAYDDFQILLCAVQTQKIQLAHPEAVTLGTLDLRQAADVQTPKEIHAKALHGFDKLDSKDRLDLYLSGMSLTQDETIPSQETIWHSGTLNLSDHSLTVRGDMEFADMYNLNISGGSLTVPGNLTCAFKNSYSQSGGNLTVGGDFTVTQGSIELQYGTTADIRGSLTAQQTGSLCLYGRAYLPELTVGGDLTINSTKRTNLQAGTLTLFGNLIQKESGYTQSLHAYDDFQILLCANQTQTIKLAHPEAVTLGTLDLRQAARVDTPDEIHAKELHGFDKLDQKDRLDLYLSGMRLRQDETIPSRQTTWHGGTLTISDYSLTVGGGMEFDGMYNLNISGGNLTVPGNLTCAFGGSYSQSGGSLTVGGNLSITKGALELQYGTTADIRGSLTAQQTGSFYLYGRGKLPSLTVGGDLTINSAKRTNLQAGTLTLGGNFTQTEDEETDNLRIYSDFILALNGTAPQTIDIPGVEEIGTLDLGGSTSVHLASDLSGTTLIGIEKLTTPEATLYVDFAHASTSDVGTIRSNLKCFGDLTIDGQGLTIQGKYTQYGGTVIDHGGTLTTTGDFTADKGTTDIRYGLIHVKGTAHIKKDAAITMKDPATCRFRTDGDYISASRTTDRWDGNEGGTLEVKGNLIQRDTSLTLGLNLEKTTVVFSGDTTQNVYTPYFRTFGYAGCIDLRKSKEVNFGASTLYARQIIGFSHIRVNGDLTLNNSRVTLIQNESFDGNINLNHTYLDLNGYTFQTDSRGSIEQNGGLVNLDGGTLCIDGNYHMEGGSILQMIRPQDLLQVKGNFSTASTMNHATMLRDGRFELWGNFNQSGAEASFCVSGNFTTAFLGHDQHAHFDDNTYHDFGIIDPEYGGVTMDDEPIIFMARLNYHLCKGFLEGLSDALGISELNETTITILASLGISTAALVAIGYGTIVAVIGAIADIIAIISSGFMIARSIGGIYSTVTGNDTIYNKAEAFGHDTAVLMVGMAFLAAGILNLAKIYTACKNAAEVTAEATSSTKASDVVKNLNKIKCISSFEDFLEIVKAFLEDEAFQYIRTAMKDDAENIARLKEVAGLLEKASESIGKKLSWGQVEAGLEALWQSGSAEKVLAAVERVFKMESKGISYGEYKYLCQKSTHNPGKDKVMLGKYDGGGETSYIKKAGKDYTYFDLGRDWDALEKGYGFSDRELFELFNEPFLEDGINQGKVFYFSHNPLGDEGALGWEYKCLQVNGYDWDEMTMTMKFIQ